MATTSSDRIAELAELLRKYKDAYYNGQPLVSDAAYDELEDELRGLDPANPVLKSVGAPALAVTEWEKARHAIPMGSLNKVVNEEELAQWAERCDQLAVESSLSPIATSLLVTEKLDGLSLAVNYEKGVLSEAITRGDGLVGERITRNARRMKGVPARLPEPLTVSIRGEIILKLSDMKIGFPGTDAPPRNRAAGTSKRYDGAGCEFLTVMFYDLEGEIEHATEEEKYRRLVELGLEVPSFRVTDLAGTLAVYKEYVNGRRASLDYEIDGLVVRANDLRAQHLLGELGGRPRAAVAFKFPSMAKMSRVVAITWETGPTGRVTPLATVEPVEIGGAVVQSVSLHNASNVERLGIGVGDEVLVSRRNDVIPYLEEVVVRHDGARASVPHDCATCHEALTRRGEYLVCVNPACRAIVEGRIRRWVGTQDVLELGDKLIAQLVEAKLVREPSDLYRLTVEDIAGLERRGTKVAKKVLDNLRAKLPLSLPVFLASLGINDFALETAKLLVGSGYDTLEKVQAATADELAAIKGMGAIKAKNVVKGLEARADEIRRLLEVGVVPTTPTTGGKLAGKTFCFTGTLPRPRKEYEDLVEKNGGHVLSSVTKDLAYLVMSDPSSASTKAEKARKYGTRCIGPDEFMVLIEGS